MCFVMFSHLLFFSFLQVEVPPPTIGGTLVKEVKIASSAVPLGVEKEPDVTKEVGQVVKDVQPTLSSVPLAAQDPEASQPPVPKIPSQ